MMIASSKEHFSVVIVEQSSEHIMLLAQDRINLCNYRAKQCIHFNGILKLSILL